MIWNIFLITSIFQIGKIYTESCPKYCKCVYGNQTSRHTGECRGKPVKLTYIPKFPTYITDIVFINNYLYNLSAITFRNISSLNITHLNLQKNRITVIERNAFQDLKFLVQLDISGNNGTTLEDVRESLNSLPKSSINELRLNHMLWSPLNDMSGIFDGLNESKINRIELSHSYLHPFNGTWFANLPSLQQLNISWNSITDDLQLSGLSNLTRLNLIGNYFNFVPNFCKAKLYKLKTLLLSDTKLGTLKHLKNHTRCLNKLERLFLNGISVPSIPNNAFSDIPSLKELMLRKLSTQMKKIDPLAFNSSSLIHLRFSKCNGFLFFRGSISHGLFDPANIFKYCPNIEDLDLSHNVIEFTLEKIRNMFTPLKKLRVIRLRFLNLATLPGNFFYRFPDLQEIHIDHNILLPWKDGNSIFHGLTNLLELHLQNNKIGMIQSTSLPAYITKSLHVLNLTNNHFICTCDLMWFRNWMKNTHVDIIGNDNYRCEGSTRLIDYNPTEIECRNIILISKTVIGSSFCLFLFITILVYCCRWRIRFQIYKMRSRARYYQQINEEDFKYSAYVIYCYEDIKWVKTNLIPKLEEEIGVKLPHRDFEVGKVFIDNIVDNMNLSKTVIPVLSNNFTQNEWCVFQLNVARSKLSKDGTVSILPIMLEEIHFKNMNSALYSLIKLSSYAAWSADENALELFWDQIKSHVQ
ncbi:toll-like receptor 13 [Mytilus galloprovincialis]|uniref:Toll-like receptor 13 n=1 Tax=Mytilus galloprovincialis TaxID=29158 RepID=A0A8B6DEV6_MYTGA|nr:toll-like receptor 13 [Mytilus galloprovincialis]